MKDVILTPNAPSGGPYSQATILNGVIYVSGQLPIDPKTSAMVEGIENQTKQALDNIKSILEAKGSNFEKVVQITILVTDIANVPKVNTVYTSYLEKLVTNFPARMCYAVKALPANALIEIACTAGC